MRKHGVFLSILFFALGLASSASAEVLVAGSSTVSPIADSAARAFMAENPGITVTVKASDTGEGFRALLDGRAQIANASRPANDKEREEAKSRGANLVEHKVAIDALVPVVNQENTVETLTVDQLRRIFAGELTNWRELGGEDMPVTLVVREEGSGTADSWGTLVMQKRKTARGAKVKNNAEAVVQEVAATPGAIGYVGIGTPRRSVLSLRVEDVEATTANATTGEYPLVRFLFMYTIGEAQGEAQAFIQFVRSLVGQKTVEKTGFVPVN